MKISFSKKFDKQMDAITELHTRVVIRNAIQKLIDTSSLSTIASLKKMKGHKNAYRMRVGNYRIGFFLQKNELFISTVAHRKDIYKSFP